jgi:hypothetical protein
MTHTVPAVITEQTVWLRTYVASRARNVQSRGDDKINEDFFKSPLDKINENFFKVHSIIARKQITSMK